MPCVELGYRLARQYWSQGYANEGSHAVLAFGFEALRLPEIVAMTATVNERSRRVMEKLGMIRDARGDFDHPNIVEGHSLPRHVLYRMSSERWRATTR